MTSLHSAGIEGFKNYGIYIVILRYNSTSLQLRIKSLSLVILHGQANSIYKINPAKPGVKIQTCIDGNDTALE